MQLTEFEWDTAKNASNYAKHGVDIIVRRPMTEERRVAIGHNVYGQFFFVVWTWRDDARRIISARKAGRYEREIHARAYGPLSP
ncbi:BrnT family toxin [Alphaproteobacteria bacterium]|nr:BrnT family toxin [Alphaproteobacteria bacterium]